MSKKVILGILGISLILMLGTAADAAVCVKKLGGTCLMWTGSVICGIDASGLGNCFNDPTFLACSATGTGEWVVACGNPGANQWTAPGINTAYFEGTVSGQTLVTPEMCDSNGNAYVFVTAKASPELLADAVAAGACPNDNWTAIDAVPCSVEVKDYELDENDCKLADATFACALPNCSTLGWDSVHNSFEQRQYNCTRTSYNRYKTPQCPAVP
jgi:hypothetical protein